MSDISEENADYLRREIKEFINVTHYLIDKVQRHNNEVQEKELNSFAEKIYQLNHFSTLLLQAPGVDESVLYNARIIKDLTETPLYDNTGSKDGCSLLKAADHLIKENECSKIKSIMGNLISNETASEVLFDDLMVIYKELAA